MEAVQMLPSGLAQPQIVAPGAWQFMLPVTVPNTVTVPYVYAYLIEDDRLTLLDCGFPADEQALVGALAFTGHVLEDLDLILYTHPHGDHVGGPLTSDPGLHATRAGSEWRLPPPAVASRIHDLPHYLNSRVPSMADVLLSSDMLAVYTALTENWPDVHLDSILADGDVVDLGSRRLEVILTPGHAPDHLAFFDRDGGHLFSGDVLMELGPGLMTIVGGGVEDYLCSLQRLTELPPNTRVFPAHAKPTLELVETIQLSTRRISRLEKSILSRLDSSWTELSSLFAGLEGPPDLIGNSMTLTLALVDWLVAGGLVEERTSSGTTKYKTTRGAADSTTDCRQRRC